MDKKKLNEEIVLCRSVVKKAKVCVIRKLIKKIKLLRSCKKEELREKKLRKGRRLAAEVHMMKTLRPDYVTKFALLTENYVPTGSNTKLKRRRNACAKLVKHKDLVEKINSIRDKFSNWREELPILLNSSKKKKSEDEEANAESGGTNNLEKPEEVTVNEEISKEELSNERPDGSRDELGPEARDKVTQKSKDKVKKQKVAKTKLKDESIEVGHAKKKVKKKKVGDNVGGDDVKNNNSDVKNPEPKIDDPFFIGKKVIMPTLLQMGGEDHPENDAKEFKQGLSRDAEEDGKPPPPPPRRDRDSAGKRPRRKSSEGTTQDELHPSWKAKKIQMIKPFEGKKIKFE